ncbi:hypothetical protein C7Y70_16925 [Pseudoalteromonas sp. KS88]|nr:hypothetical protein C7Y70_16925 [Pseudoalteromonas sp. KS88]
MFWRIVTLFLNLLLHAWGTPLAIINCALLRGQRDWDNVIYCSERCRRNAK